MIKTLNIILTVLLTSFFFFPVDFTFLPVNTKNILAVVGLGLLLLNMARKRDVTVPTELLILLLLSGMVSLLSLISITYNQTPDTSYVTFIRSTVIWLCSAFTVACTIRAVHGRIDVPLIVNYLIGTCLFQCVMTMLIAFVPSVQLFVDAYVQQGQTILHDLNRLYGVGASLDVAGSRFSAVLVAIAFLLAEPTQKNANGKAIFYTLSFIIISVVGNMIARTTSTGMIIGVVWFLLVPLLNRQKVDFSSRFGKAFSILLTGCALVILCVVLYRAFPEVKQLFEFGFEGFFSYFQTGEWQTDSTDTLKSMIVWPEELRTWVIGDGYFLNSRYDPNYLGDATNKGFYMGTDIGYLRFIFYFGIAGLIWIIAFIAYAAYVCGKAFEDYAWLFFLALLVGLVVWAKVSTDIFLFFAIFLCAAALREPQEESPENIPAKTEKP